ncbi:hypothetical protein LTR86_001797 [Recurvomyces mirabilis]|nr:hypothetical protein LTR86_001797 [Recurvomyces mirabilis]
MTKMQHRHQGHGLFAAPAPTINHQPHSNGRPLRRMHEPAVTQPQSSRLDWDNVHVRANGQAVASELLYTEDDPFIQDLRAQAGAVARLDTGSDDYDLPIAGRSAERQYDNDQQIHDQSGNYAIDEEMSDVGVDPEAHQQINKAKDEEEEDDLFKNAFGNMKESPEEEDEDDDSDIIEITAVTPANPNKLKPNGKPTQRIHDHDIAAEHTPNCHPHRNTSTPPTSPKPTKTPTTPLPPTGPREANLQKDLRPSLRRHHRIHLHTLTLAPRHRHPLPPTRYLISVLHASRKKPTLSTSTSSSGSNQEKHHIWMLGNRLTTISTVRHTYTLTTLSAEPVVLLHGTERLRDTDLVSQVDYFGDRYICLRAVWVRDPGTGVRNPEARGRELTEGLVGRPVLNSTVVPEVVVLDE